MTLLQKCLSVHLHLGFVASAAGSGAKLTREAPCAESGHSSNPSSLHGAGQENPSGGHDGGPRRVALGDGPGRLGAHGSVAPVCLDCCRFPELLGLAGAAPHGALGAEDRAEPRSGAFAARPGRAEAVWRVFLHQRRLGGTFPIGFGWRLLLSASPSVWRPWPWRSCKRPRRRRFTSQVAYKRRLTG